MWVPVERLPASALEGEHSDAHRTHAHAHSTAWVRQAATRGPRARGAVAASVHAMSEAQHKAQQLRLLEAMFETARALVEEVRNGTLATTKEGFDAAALKTCKATFTDLHGHCTFRGALATTR